MGRDSSVFFNTIKRPHIKFSECSVWGTAYTTHDGDAPRLRIKYKR